MMPFMGKLTYSDKIPGRSIPSIKERFGNVLLYFQAGKRVPFRGNQLSGEALTNALVLHFLDLDRAEQEAILKRYVPIFEGLLETSGGGGAVEAGPAPSTPTIDATPGKKARERRA